MAETALQETLSELSKRVGYDIQLKSEQRDSIINLLCGNDVLAILPTGYGKSFIFQLFVLAKSKLSCQVGQLASCYSCLVICPLESIVRDQIAEARSLGITALKLDEDFKSNPSQEAQLLFGSAEYVIQPWFRSLLTDENSTLHNIIKLVVVDESHTVETWTGKRRKRGNVKQEAFRSAFGELSVLRSLCSQGTPLLALTGTADSETQNTIATSLALKGTFARVFVSPNRRNLKITVCKTGKSQIFSKLNWLISMIRTQGCSMPKTLLFCNTMTDIASVLNHLLMVLGKDAYYPSNSKMTKDCLIDVYHANTWSHTKDMIISSLKETSTSKKRIIIASTALSMGVNFPDIEYIINWGPARTLLDFHQEAGRAGRDGRKANVIVIYHGHMATHCEPDVKSFIRSEECLRVASLLPLDTDIVPILPGHDCCGNCHRRCKCNGNSCNIPMPAYENEEDPQCDICEITPLSRHVTDEDKLELKTALEELTMKFGSQGSIVLSPQDQTQILRDLVSQSDKIFTVQDIVNNFPILSLPHVVKILEVFDEIFEDIECVGEMVDLLNFQGELSDDFPFIDLASFEED